MVCQIVGICLYGTIKKVKENLVANALSRKVETEDILVPDMLFSKADFEDFTFEGGLDSQEGVLCMISFLSPAWLTDLKTSYDTDQQV